ncbi:YlxQ family RNA-binding protein [Priestia taiwanensis]|uniref:Ribosomal protein YlxQ n=1 Tax=Priestia taiwanensis TaxID=1347902 RepID=A0A917APB0_9BACI|nr:YlxQ family RNA-binding protein [Priestia taiwanensis]MBM7362803.1 ribosomal protein L7Ae-like RNA K-turn-binding protein [Priestia taiwanensis]GGE65234.1 putative ribosomal protein YlxQ [Priestia taiwanensis]
MSDNNKWKSLLGIANRARKITSGEELVIKEVRSNRAKLVIIAADASNNTMKKVTDKASYYKVPVKTVSDRYELGNAIGKDARVVVAVTDAGFANKLKTLM